MHVGPMSDLYRFMSIPCRSYIDSYRYIMSFHICLISVHIDCDSCLCRFVWVLYRFILVPYRSYIHTYRPMSITYRLCMDSYRPVPILYVFRSVPDDSYVAPYRFHIDHMSIMYRSMPIPHWSYIDSYRSHVDPARIHIDPTSIHIDPISIRYQCYIDPY